MVPLHWHPGPGAVVTALHTGLCNVTHTNFVTIVEKRCSGHGQEEGEGNLHLLRVQKSPEPLHIVVARGDADRVLPMGPLVIPPVGFHKRAGVAFSLSAEPGMLTAKQVQKNVHPPPVGLGKQFLLCPPEKRYLYYKAAWRKF